MALQQICFYIGSWIGLFILKDQKMKIEFEDKVQLITRMANVCLPDVRFILIVQGPSEVAVVSNNDKASTKKLLIDAVKDLGTTEMGDVQGSA